MSESSTETVPVVLAEEQLLRLASAVATSLTAYFEAKEEESSVITADPVEVTVTESVTGEQPAPDEQEEEADDVAASVPDVADGQSTVDEATASVESPEETDSDSDTDTDTDTEATGTEAA